MKKVLVLVLTLAMALSFSLTALAGPTQKNGDLPDFIEPNGGPYIIVTALSEDSVTFKFGWSNKNFFEKTPVEIWIGVQDQEGPSWVRHEEFLLKEHKANYKDVWTVELIPGHQNVICFWIRCDAESDELVWEYGLNLN